MEKKDDLRVQVIKDEVNTPESQQEREQAINKYISMYLRNLGIPTNLLGYRYVTYAIALCIKFPEKIHAVTKELYPETGKKYGTTGSRVERAIRNAIEVGWERADTDAIDKIFGHTVSFKKGKPTNSEFISTIAEEIRNNYQI